FGMRPHGCLAPPALLECLCLAARKVALVVQPLTVASLALQQLRPAMQRLPGERGGAKWWRRLLILASAAALCAAIVLALAIPATPFVVLPATRANQPATGNQALPMHGGGFFALSS